MDDDMFYNKYNHIKKDYMIYKKYNTEENIIKDGFLMDAGDDGGPISDLIALNLYLLLLRGGLVGLANLLQMLLIKQ
eukprot:14083808-Heterocapsa_arctica.AAC.1